MKLFFFVKILLTFNDTWTEDAYDISWLCQSLSHESKTKTLFLLNCKI